MTWNRQTVMWVGTGDTDHESGYYAEYTVLSATSCEGPRGELRIVTGDGGEYYWTEDHYESFQRIARRAG